MNRACSKSQPIFYMKNISWNQCPEIQYCASQRCHPHPILTSLSIKLLGDISPTNPTSHTNNESLLDLRWPIWAHRKAQWASSRPCLGRERVHLGTEMIRLKGHHWNDIKSLTLKWSSQQKQTPVSTGGSRCTALHHFCLVCLLRGTLKNNLFGVAFDVLWHPGVMHHLFCFAAAISSSIYRQELPHNNAKNHPAPSTPLNWEHRPPPDASCDVRPISERYSVTWLLEHFKTIF